MQKGALMPAALLAAMTVGMAAPAAAQSSERPADEAAAKHSLAVKIVAAAFPESQRLEILGGMMDALTSQMTSTFDNMGDKEMQAITEKHLGIMRGDIMADLRANSGGMFDAIAVAYARGFSLQELQDIERFVTTPSGAAYVQRSPKLLNDPAVAEWNTAYFKRVMGIVEVRKRALIEDLSAHMAKNTGTK